MHLSNFHPQTRRSAAPPVHYVHQNHEIAQTEDEELASNNGRSFTGNNEPDSFTTRRRGPPSRVITNEPSSQNIQFTTPSFAARESVTWENEESQRARAMSGNYLHLSYYGEEVDKEYLPDVAEPSFVNNDDFQDHHQQRECRTPVVVHWNLNSAGQNQHQPLQWKKSFRTAPNLHNLETERYQQRQSPNDWKRYENGQLSDWKTGHNNNHLDAAADVYDYPNMVVNVSAPEGVSNFKTAASYFQERQANNRNNAKIETPQARTRGWNTFQEGWSGIADNVTVKRKVALCNNDDHETRLRKRLNRFQEPVVGPPLSFRRRTDKVSLEDIIKNKRIKQAQKPGAKHSSHYRSTFFKQPRPVPSTWKSGDGKSFSAGFDNGYNNMNDYGQYEINDAFQYYQREPQRWNNESYGRQRNRERPDNRPTFRNNFAHNWNACGGGFEESSGFKAVVIDGSNVAFTFGEDLHFACEGIRICVNFFVQMGCKNITVVVPKDRLKRGASKDVAILQDLKQQNMLLVNWGGRFTSDGNDADDRLFILDVARNKNGIIISNLNFTDVARYNPGLRQSVWNRVLNFQFTNATPKEIQFPDIDESGMFGPTWQNILNI